MIFFTTGVIEENDKYTGMPREVTERIYANSTDRENKGVDDMEPRRWSHDHVIDYSGDSFEKPHVTVDIPILEVDDFTAYASLVGFKIRWCNHDSNVLYDKGNHQNKMTTWSKNNVAWIWQKASNLVLWNCEEGLRARYAKRTEFVNVTIVNRLSHDRVEAEHDEDEGRSQAMDKLWGPNHFDWPYTGAEFKHDSLRTMRLENLLIDGYPVAVWTRNWEYNANQHITLVDDPNRDYHDQLEDKRLLGKKLKPEVTPSISNVQSDRFTVSWTGAGGADGCLLRYKPTASPYWTYKTVGASPVTITGLDASTEYEVQFMYTDADKLSPWKAASAPVTTTSIP